MIGEFDIISRYFERDGLAAAPADPRVPLGIGDDCALLRVPAGRELALTMDLLVEGVHFPAGADPVLVGHKALAVNLSDLAAMGAQPLAFTLGLTLREASEDWLAGFSTGLRALAREQACPLVGGDVTRGGVLCIAVQAHGLVEEGRALRRDGARPGDLVYVSGTLGDAAAGLRLVTGEIAAGDLDEDRRRQLADAYHRPRPRIALGRALKGVASAAIDVSDGLLADLGHVARRSGVHIRLRARDIPLSPALEALLGRERALPLALGGGEDYELAFTVPPAQAEEVERRARSSGVHCTCIGEVSAGSGVECEDEAGRPLPVANSGYRHF